MALLVPAPARPSPFLSRRHRGMIRLPRPSGGFIISASDNPHIYEWLPEGVLRSLPVDVSFLPADNELTALGAGGRPFSSGPLAGSFVATANGIVRGSGGEVVDFWSDIWAINTGGEVILRHRVSDFGWSLGSLEEYEGNILTNIFETGFTLLDPETLNVVFQWIPPAEFEFPGGTVSFWGPTGYTVIRHGSHAGEIVIADGSAPGFYAIHPDRGITWAIGGSQDFYFGPSPPTVDDFYFPWIAVHTKRDTLILVDNANGNWREVDWNGNLLRFVSYWNFAEENPDFFPESTVELDKDTFVSVGVDLFGEGNLIVGKWQAGREIMTAPVTPNQMTFLESSFLESPAVPVIPQEPGNGGNGGNGDGGPTEGDFTTDFEEYAPGSPPSDWVPYRGNTDGIEWTVEDANGNQVLRADSSTTEPRFLVWKPAGMSPFVAGSILVRMVLSNGWQGLGLNADDTGPVPAFPAAEIEGATGAIRIGWAVDEGSGAAFSVSLNGDRPDLTTGTAVLMRLETGAPSGGDTPYRVRFWKEGDPEPETWDLEDSFPADVGGFPALIAEFGTRDFSWVAVTVA